MENKTWIKGFPTESGVYVAKGKYKALKLHYAVVLIDIEDGEFGRVFLGSKCLGIDMRIISKFVKFMGPFNDAEECTKAISESKRRWNSR